MTGRSANHGAAALTHDSKRPQIQLAYMLIVAGGNRGNRSVDILDSYALQILRLESFTRPSAGGGAVITEGTTHAIVVASTGKQCINFLGGSLGAAQAELEDAAHAQW